MGVSSRSSKSIVRPTVSQRSAEMLASRKVTNIPGTYFFGLIAQ